jgi:uncharacterized protein YbjT (DUF2867 family)
MRPVLVTGGTGRLGRPLVDRLVNTGRPVRVASRRPGPSRPGVEYVRVDVRTGAGLAAAVAGVDAAVACATTNGRGDIAAMRHLLAAASGAGSPHLVYVSIVGIDRVPIPYYRAKLAAEGLLAASGLPWTVLRATQFHDLVTDFFDRQRWSPVLVVPARTDVQPVDTRDVAARLVELVAGPRAGRVPDMGGPLVHSVRELADAYIRARGLRRAVLPVPLPGSAGRAYREGRHLTPEHATGRLTFADHLRDRGYSGLRAEPR